MYYLLSLVNKSRPRRGPRRDCARARRGPRRGRARARRGPRQGPRQGRVLDGFIARRSNCSIDFAV